MAGDVGTWEFVFLIIYIFPTLYSGKRNRNVRVETHKHFHTEHNYFHVERVLALYFL